MTNLLALLQEFHQDKLAMMLRHEAGARVISQYDFNNAYQYTVNREDVQLTWLRTAIAELGGTIGHVPSADRTISGKGSDAMRRVFEEDTRDAQAFVDRWQTRVDTVGNARHRGMLRVILGETLEQKRSFEQALAGRTDLLGRRSQQVDQASGEVLAVRWIE